MELDSNWSSIGSPATNERSSTQAHAGTYSRKFVPDAAHEGISSDAFAELAGALYKGTAYSYPPLAKTRFYYNGASLSNVDSPGYSTLTPTTWNLQTLYATAAGTGTSGYLKFTSHSESSGTWYIDDVSCQRVTDVAATGLHLHSTPYINDRKMARVDAAFAPNSVTAYRVYRVY
jgi:hypothetical protein